MMPIRDDVNNSNRCYLVIEMYLGPYAHVFIGASVHSHKIAVGRRNYIDSEDNRPIHGVFLVPLRNPRPR